MKTCKSLVMALTASLLLAFNTTAQAANPEVVLETTLGNVTIELYPESAPVTVANFLAYVDSGYYEGTIFHRVIPRFMVQGGGFNKELQQKATADPIINEAQNRLHNERGTVAMARTNDPDSATSQFYINLKMNMSLDWTSRSAGYTVFGAVSDGMDVVDTMVLEPTGQVDQYQDVPVEPIVIIKAYRKAATP